MAKTDYSRDFEKSEATPGPWTIRFIEPDFGQLQHDMHARIEAPFKANGEGIPGKFYEVAMLNFVAMKRNKYNILRDEGVANAELIVKAVNSHNTLVEALEALTTELRESYRWGTVAGTKHSILMFNAYEALDTAR